MSGRFEVKRRAQRPQPEVDRRVRFLRHQLKSAEWCACGQPEEVLCSGCGRPLCFTCGGLLGTPDASRNTCVDAGPAPDFSDLDQPSDEWPVREK